MRRNGVSVCLVMALLLGSIVVLDVTMDITPRVEAITIYVDDDYGSEDATHKMTIQTAVDAANPGDTVFVYNGTYYEDVTVAKTINLTGINRDNTTIRGSDSGHGIWINDADYVNVTGFTAKTIINGGGVGIGFTYSNYSLLSNCRTDENEYGIIISNCNWMVVNNNIAINNWNYQGIYLSETSNSSIINNLATDSNSGIWLQSNCYNNEIINNNCSYNQYGITIGSTNKYNNIENNTLYSNMWYGIWDTSRGGNTHRNLTIKESWAGFHIATFSQDTHIVNSTIKDSSNYDIYIDGSNTYLTSINTSFNKTKTLLGKTTNQLIVNWYLHINVTDTLGNPIPSATVCIKDNQNSLPAQKYTTDAEGYIRWLTQTEYIEQDTNGDTIGEKTYCTPHRITAWNETIMGYAEVNINESKEVNIVLDTPYYEIPLSAGWNLISLPLVQSDTSISTVLSSIAGNWDVVWWYNASDGKWHSTNGDLNDINHTMGFWIHMKTADTLIVTGTIPNTTSIQLYQGWNLVGNPSFCIHGIDDILSPIATKYAAVQQFNSWDSGDPWKHYHINKPPNLNDLAYMTSGRGYWLYVTEDVVWEVSNF